MTNKLLTVGTLVAVSLFGFSTVAHADSSAYRSTGVVGFAPTTEVTPPHNPDNPGQEIKPVDPETPGMPGPLSIDFASSFNFGNHLISNKDATYDAAAQEVEVSSKRQYVPDYVQVSDYRGTHAGWTLQLAQEGQFKSATSDRASVLTGAVLSLHDARAVGTENTPSPMVRDGALNPNGSSSIVMEAAKGTGSGTWMMPWGTDNDLLNDDSVAGLLNDAKVTLSVPGTTPRDAATYTTKLMWTLINVPLQN